MMALNFIVITLLDTAINFVTNLELGQRGKGLLLIR